MIMMIDRSDLPSLSTFNGVDYNIINISKVQLKSDD